MEHKRFSAILAGFALGAMALTGCSPGPGKPDVELQLSLGVFFDPDAAPQDTEDVAVMMAVDEINAADKSLHIDLVYAGNDGTIGDEGSSGSEGETAEPSLVTPLLEQGVDVILAPSRFELTESMLEEVVADKTVLFNVGEPFPDSYNWVSNGYYLSAGPSAWLYGRAIAEYSVLNDQEFIGVIRENDLFSTLAKEGLVNELLPVTNQVVVDAPYAEGDRQFFGAIDKALSQKPQQLVVLSEEETPDLVSAILRAGYPATQLLLASHSVHDFPEEIDIAGATAITADYVVSEEFEARFTEYLSSLLRDSAETEDSGIEVAPEKLAVAARAYDSVMLTGLAALYGQDTEAKSVSSAIRQVSGGEDVSEDTLLVTNFADAAQAIFDGNLIDFEGEGGGYGYGSSGEITQGKFTVYVYDDAGKLSQSKELQIPNQEFIDLLDKK